MLPLARTQRSRLETTEQAPRQSFTYSVVLCRKLQPRTLDVGHLTIRLPPFVHCAFSMAVKNATRSSTAVLVCLLLSAALLASPVQSRVAPREDAAVAQPAGNVIASEVLERRHLTVIPQGGVALKKYEDGTRDENGDEFAAADREEGEYEEQEGDAAADPDYTTQGEDTVY